MGKGARGGKRSGSLLTGGYYGSNTAGIPREFEGKEAGTKREFIGSGSNEYVFYSETRGILTVRADSFEQAWRIARSRGYSRKRFKE